MCWRTRNPKTATMENHAERPEVSGRVAQRRRTRLRDRALRSAHSFCTTRCGRICPAALPWSCVWLCRWPVSASSSGVFGASLWLWSLLIYLFAGAIAMLMSRVYTRPYRAAAGVFAPRCRRRLSAASFRRVRRFARSAGSFAEPDGVAAGPDDPHVDRRAQSIRGHPGLDGGRRGGRQCGRTAGVCEPGLRVDFGVGCSSGRGKFAARSGAPDGTDWSRAASVWPENRASKRKSLPVRCGSTILRRPWLRCAREKLRAR